MKVPRFVFEHGSKIKLPGSLRAVTNEVSLLTQPAEQLRESRYNKGIADSKLRSPQSLLFDNFTSSYTPIDFPHIPQHKTKWCWAAVSLAVATHYNENISLTQADIASRVYSACNMNDPNNCNNPAELDNITLGSHYNSREPAPLSPTALNEQINGEERRPVCIGIKWYGGGDGHFVVIYGIDMKAHGSPILYIMDPDPDRETIPPMEYAALYTSYLNEGYWYESYFTKG